MQDSSCIREYRVRGTGGAETGPLGMWAFQDWQDAGHQRRLGWGGRREWWAHKFSVEVTPSAEDNSSGKGASMRC